jgi:hypothetical protein
MEGENKYPIYRVEIRWDQDDFEDNCTGYATMYKVDPTLSGAIRDAKHRWEKYIHERHPHTDPVPLKEKHPKITKFEVWPQEYETWCLSWFSHYTFNTHLHDLELVHSFDEFCERKKKLNVQYGHFPTDWRKDGHGPYYCLMGADERWRRKGPCRCEHCQAFGIVRIDH